jgi:D-glycero-D-manno-heptose 1,7-bisphosphate phosphatase
MYHCDLRTALREDFIWCQIRRRVFRNVRPALFLDRDGVLVEEVNYLHRVEDVQIIEGAARLIAAANDAGLPVIMVTNQAGIGRGYYDWNDFALVNDFILRQFENDGGYIDAVIACPYHENGMAHYRQENHPMRKPNPGMFLLAKDCIPMDISHSIIVGDQASDQRAALAAGLQKGFHVLTGHGVERRDEVAQVHGQDFDLTIVPSVADIRLLDAITSLAE